MESLSNSETAVNCPKCGGLFRIPAGLSRDATIECPHCSAELTVQDLMDAIPAAKIGKGRGSAAAPSVVINEGNSGTAEPGRSRHAFDDQEFTIPKPLKTAIRTRHRAAVEGTASEQVPLARSKSTRRTSSFAKKKSGPGEILKIILGGLAAIPVAQLVLWWVFAADPLNMAPKVFDVFPAIVPPALAPADVLGDEADDDEKLQDLPPEVNLIESMKPVMPIK